jgi:L-seryl-tRNA(Ser) seleniumtransferase
VLTGYRTELYKKLPSVDEVIRRETLSALISREGQVAVIDAVRAVLSSLRSEIDAGRLDAESIELALTDLNAAVERQLRRSLRFSLRPVINATGVVLHTNLGRAPLPAAALDHISDAALSYSNLEFDLETGQRGKRDVHVERLFSRLFSDSFEPAAKISTIVVNNNAAAVLLALNTFADGGEVIVSRGELVEIGGSFRIPDVMAKSNAALREVGTTNRTRVRDYEQAIGPKTCLLLRVHRSNFQITGFTEQPELEELVRLAQERKLPLMEDLGSGALFDLRSVGVTGEPTVMDSLRAGVDIVTFSGDKLLGGPQAGLLSGRSELIARMRSNSLFRALRVDKLTYAALEATLMAHLKGDYDAIPTVRMMQLSKASILKRAEAIAKELRSFKGRIELIDGESVIGGGAAPAAALPTCLIALSGNGLSADDISTKLRAFDPAVIARVEEGRVLLDLRTVFPEQDVVLVRALQQIGQ